MKLNIDQIKYNTSEELCEQMAARNGSVILSFSAGKDSIAAWLQMRRYFKNIVPVYFYLIPGLGFIEKSLNYYEDYFDTKIIRMPHPQLYKWLNTGFFMDVEREKMLKKMKLPKFTTQDSFNLIRLDYLNNDESVFSGIGVRAADNVKRYISIKKSGAINEQKKQFFPVYDWNKERLINEFRQAKIKLPIDYKLFGRSFDGLFYEYLGPIKANFPDDYEKIKFYFPLIDAEINRFEFRRHEYESK